MKLAQTAVDFQKKQYETKTIGDRELYDSTMNAVRRLRDFSIKYAKLEVENRQMFSSLPASLESNEVRRLRFLGEINKNLQISQAKQSEFQSSILPDAIYARNQLLQRNLPEPLLTPSERTDLNVVFKGMVAGINPEMTLATHLELWVKPLARR